MTTQILHNIYILHKNFEIIFLVIFFVSLYVYIYEILIT